jgi:hypothetical protein
MIFPQDSDYKYMTPCSTAAKLNDISEQIYASIFTFLLCYVLIRALNQALQCTLLGVAE